MIDDEADREALLGVTGAVGALSLRAFNALDSLTVETKGPADYVSRADREAETLARRLLADAFPGDPVLGEEQGGTVADRYWIVDPIDGSANFLSGLPVWAVSIARIENGRPVLGAIALPALGLIVSGGTRAAFSAKGEWPARVGSAPLAFGIGRNPHWPAEARAKLEAELESEGHHIVALGSCAASLALVALGRLAGYVEHHTRPWDAAAGHAICEAAGIASTLTQRGPDMFVDIEARLQKP